MSGSEQSAAVAAVKGSDFERVLHGVQGLLQFPALDFARQGRSEAEEGLAWLKDAGRGFGDLFCTLGGLGDDRWASLSRDRLG